MPYDDNFPEFRALRASRSQTGSTQEIRLMRRLIRETHRAVRKGSLDYLDGVRLIARLAEAVTLLTNAQRRLEPADHAADKAIAELDRALRTMHEISSD